MSATNATTWETIALGLKLWALATAVTLLLPLLLIATLVYGVFGGKMKPLPKPDLSTMEVPTGPWNKDKANATSQAAIDQLKRQRQLTETVQRITREGKR